MFTYIPELNQPANDQKKKNIVDFELMRKNIKDKKEYRKNKHILIQAEKNKGTPEELKAKYLSSKLSEKGFFELPKVAALTDESKAELIDNIANRPTNSVKIRLGYQIAMLGSLGLMEKFYTDTGETRHRYLAETLDSNITEVKNQINSLNPKFDGNKSRYIAAEFKQQVKEHYEMLK